jgi:hypothetical protein
LELSHLSQPLVVLGISEMRSLTNYLSGAGFKPWLSWSRPPESPGLQTCPPVFKKDIFVCFRELYREFPCDISMDICVITWIVSSPPFFSFLP